MAKIYYITAKLLQFLQIFKMAAATILNFTGSASDTYICMCKAGKAYTS